MRGDYTMPTLEERQNPSFPKKIAQAGNFVEERGSHPFLFSPDSPKLRA